MAAVAGEYCDRVLRIPKSGKRAAIAAGLAASDPATDVVVVVDSDTVWQPGALTEMLRPFDDPRVGGVTPRQAIFDVGDDPVRRLADWIEDLRYHLTVPAQSVFGQVGCLAGRTIAYRRRRSSRRWRALVSQKVFGVPLHVGDDRVLTNELLRNGWRTVYQSTARRADRRPVGLAHVLEPAAALGALEPARDAAEPAAGCGGARSRSPLRDGHRDAVRALRRDGRWPWPTRSGGGDGRTGLPVAPELALGYLGMVASIGIRQIPHFRRSPARPAAGCRSSCCS